MRSRGGARSFGGIGIPLALAVAFFARPPSAAGELTDFGGHDLDRLSLECLSSAERLVAMELADDAEKSFMPRRTVSSASPAPSGDDAAVEAAGSHEMGSGGDSTTSGTSTSSSSNGSPFAFFPQAGRPYGDLLFVNYVDLDDSRGIKDYGCGSFTYNGHRGIDSALRSFDEQRIGVPVFAAADGTVLVTIDGNADENTACDGDAANYIILGHEDGRRTAYLHLRKYSITVARGQRVRAGRQIALTGSSGCSTGPHLHFETWEDGVPVEPFAGRCRPGASEWERQSPYRTDTHIFDFGVTSKDLAAAAPPPYRWPTSPQIDFADESVSFWARITNLPSDSSWRVRFLRPDETVAYDSGAQSFGNGSFWRTSQWRWRYRLRDLHRIDGRWTILLDINGVKRMVAPFLVVAKKSSGFNRPPRPVRVAFTPVEPHPSDVLFCRVSTSRTYDDPDWDVVRYRYAWSINGTTIRRVTTAAQSDAIPKYRTRRGDVVECSVTPTDGKNSASPSTVEVVVE